MRVGWLLGCVIACGGCGGDGGDAPLVGYYNVTSGSGADVPTGFLIGSGASGGIELFACTSPTACGSDASGQLFSFVEPPILPLPEGATNPLIELAGEADGTFDVEASTAGTRGCEGQPNLDPGCVSSSIAVTLLRTASSSVQIQACTIRFSFQPACTTTPQTCTAPALTLDQVFATCGSGGIGERATIDGEQPD